MKHSEIRRFERVLAQLESLHAEIGALSKPDAALTSLQTEVALHLFREAHDVLTDTHRPFPAVPTLGDDTKNGDALVLASQYARCFAVLRADHVKKRHGEWYWKVTEDEGGKPCEVQYVPLVQAIAERAEGAG